MAFETALMDAGRNMPDWRKSWWTAFENHCLQVQTFPPEVHKVIYEHTRRQMRWYTSSGNKVRYLFAKNKMLNMQCAQKHAFGFHLAEADAAFVSMATGTRKPSSWWHLVSVRPLHSIFFFTHLFHLNHMFKETPAQLNCLKIVSVFSIIRLCLTNQSSPPSLTSGLKPAVIGPPGRRETDCSCDCRLILWGLLQHHGRQAKSVFHRKQPRRKIQ